MSGSRVTPHGLRLAGVALLLVALGGCRGCVSGRPPIHLNPNMDYQPKLQPQEASRFFADGAGMRPPVEGTVAQEDPVELDAFVTGLGPGASRWRRCRRRRGSASVMPRRSRRAAPSASRSTARPATATAATARGCCASAPAW